MKTSFDSTWLEWIATNIARNCNIDEMNDILLANDFCPELIQSHLRVHSTALFAINQNLAEKTLPPSTQPEILAKPNNTVGKNVYLANADKIDTRGKLELFNIDNFLNAQECVDLLSLIRGSLRESTITNKSGTLKNYRTSKTCDLSLLNHPLVNDIDQRICKALGFNSSYSEPIQAQWYNKHQEFKPHTDYFEPNSEEFDTHAKLHGQRTWTFMIYLNNTLAGGATEFTRLNKVFLPKRGRAVIWNSLTAQGNENIESMHCGSPVEDGFKVIITKWFRLKGSGKRFTKEPNEYLPCYTDEGFFKTTLPEQLFKKITDFYHEFATKTLNQENTISIRQENKPLLNTSMPLTENLTQEIQQTVQPLVEAWFGHYLKLTQLSGIKSYFNGTVIAPRRQKSHKSVVCVVINVLQVESQPWPLIIDDHNYRSHQLLLKPGDMVFYESAKLKHGRPDAFNGAQYANIYLDYHLPPVEEE